MKIPKSPPAARCQMQNDLLGKTITIRDPATGEEYEDMLLKFSPACSELCTDYRSRFKFKTRDGRITDEPFDERNAGFETRAHVIAADSYLTFGLVHHGKLRADSASRGTVITMTEQPQYYMRNRLH